MTSLYSEYIQERENKSIVEHDKGFATYKIIGLECYIIDIYVKPEARKEGLASKMADEITEIAKSKGCKILSGSVYPAANGSTESLKVLLAYGFKLHDAQNGMISMYKEIG